MTSAERIREGQALSVCVSFNRAKTPIVPLWCLDCTTWLIPIGRVEYTRIMVLFEGNMLACAVRGRVRPVTSTTRVTTLFMPPKCCLDSRAAFKTLQTSYKLVTLILQNIFFLLRFHFLRRVCDRVSQPLHHHIQQPSFICSAFF